MIEHPLANITRDKLKKVFLLLLVLTIVMMVALNAINAPLATDAAPLGIISYELAGTATDVQEILDSWDHVVQLHAAFGVGLDYLFLLVYSTMISVGCLMAASVLQARRWPFASIAMFLAWGLWLAAFLDAVENAVLIVMLFGAVVNPLPQIAYFCAFIKFSLVFAGLIYIFYAGAIRMVVKE